MKILSALLMCLGLWGCSPQPDTRGISSQDIVSGYTFLTPDSQALQDDDFSNPGFLWVDRGEALFAKGPNACASCHQEGLEGAAASYPKMDAPSGTLINLEGRINMCKRDHQSEAPFAYESDDLLALTAFVAAQSRGHAVSVDTSGQAQGNYQAGKAYFYQRRGQFNLACSTCHDENWGKKLRGDTISQGHGNGFPAYRFEWQSLGSLHRRMSDCDAGVRAAPLPLGSQTYLDLELYLAARGSGLEIETPAVRR